MAKDSDWAQIDSRLCLVTAFLPMAKMEQDKVVAVDLGMPYGSVHLRCENDPDEIVGFITHKTDFGMLWAAFNERSQVAGTRLEVRSDKLNRRGLGDGEEVWLAWTQKRYRTGAGLFRKFLPHVVVMVSPKGAFDIAVDRTGRVRPDLQGYARALATSPLATWTPDVMD